MENKQNKQQENWIGVKIEDFFSDFKVFFK